MMRRKPQSRKQPGTAGNGQTEDERMTSKRANWLFLTIILTHIGAVALLMFAGAVFSFGIVANFFVSEGILMVPTLLFLLFSGPRRGGESGAQRAAGAAAIGGAHEGFQRPPTEGESTAREGQCAAADEGYAPALRQWRSAAGFHRIKVSTFFMITLCTLLIMPFVTVLNTLTLFFTDNAVAAIEGDILTLPFPVMLFVIGIFGPFCEEFVFRGVMYGSYVRGDEEVYGASGEQGGTCARRRCIPAALLSALAFGLMHMNFNQALYAFGIGVFLAFLMEAAGSLWAAVFCHMFFNSVQVALMYLAEEIFAGEYGQAFGGAAEAFGDQELLAALSVYLVIAAVATPIAVCVLVWIAKNEGRGEAVRAMFGETKNNKRYLDESAGAEKEDSHLLTVPLIVAIVLCLGFMSLEWFLYS